MLGTCLTATLVVVEVGLVGYNLHQQGVFKDLAKRFKKQIKRDFIPQDTLKDLSWKH